MCVCVCVVVESKDPDLKKQASPVFSLNTHLRIPLRPGSVCATITGDIINSQQSLEKNKHVNYAHTPQGPHAAGCLMELVKKNTQESDTQVLFICPKTPSSSKHTAESRLWNERACYLLKSLLCCYLEVGAV